MQIPTLPRPATGTAAEWSEACSRLESYLRAYQLADIWHEGQLFQRILVHAMERHAASPGVPPVTITLQEARRQIDLWYANVFAGQGHPADKLSAVGCVAVLVSGTHAQCPGLFLEENVPPQTLSALKDIPLRTGPDLEISNMIPRDLDYGPLQRIARETWQTFEWSPVLKAFLLWAVIYVIGYLTITRYVQGNGF